MSEVKIPTPPTVEPSRRAQEEEDELKHEIGLKETASEHRRSETARSVLSIAFLVLIGAVFLELIGGTLVLAFHYTAPENIHWLEKDQVTRLQTITLSAVTIGAISSYVRHYLE